MATWKTILLATGAFAFVLAFVSLFFTSYKKKQLIKKFKLETESLENISENEKISLKTQIFELKSETWLLESLEFVVNKINSSNFKKTLFLENDGLVACLSKKNIPNLETSVSILHLDQEKFQFNSEKLETKNINLVSNFEPFFDFILISTAIHPSEITFFFELIKKEGCLIWKYQKKQRKTIIKFLESQKITFSEYFYYGFLVILIK
ncbi:BC85_0335 family putative methyltransferase [Mycoplasma sp. 'Moose RK']|uniref:BC85_0335 family putative methyltransferase n=1 Tax=Mycoplasma sp. 'Moose RK' TaxID=2780095 RepID=UPI0018C2DFA2|nr:hypothetical protein [Mycoplasma sp. 'Moose RK']MBG0730530.1 hypothetical protein [Mycoplasma sp. 'Moose RK']